MRFLVKLRRAIVKLLPIRNIILFESVPDLSDNTKAVFDEFLSRGYNKKYKMVWIVNNIPSLNYIHNVVYCCPKKRIDHFKLFIYKLTSKCLICCNDFLCSQRKGQISFYLSHGAHIKSSRKYYTIPEKINYGIALCEGVKETYSFEFNINPYRVFSLGYPRNDILSKKKSVDIKNLLNVKADKVVVWYPTYRQSRNSDFNGMNPLPLIKDSEAASVLNSFLAEKNIVFVIKPHFNQNLRFFKAKNYSNLIFINDEFYKNNDISAYEFISNCDALITDYSSVYYDFLICDKPIALIWEDIELYKEFPGLVKDYKSFCSGAKIVYDLDELLAFLDDLYNEHDYMKKNRDQIIKKLKIYTDGQSAKRVTDFIIEKAGLSL